MNQNIDINTGLDFERAKQRSNEDAGAAFREMMDAKANGDTAAAESKRKAYVQLTARAKSLQPGDAAGIASILGGA